MTPIFTATALPSSLKETFLQLGIWKEACPVSLNRLRLLTISYSDFDGITHTDGQMVVLDAVAEAVLAIFRELYVMQFPIAKIRGIEAYGGNDILSMEDNNSSCFNFRPIQGSNLLSIHSYGLAIDINPLQNPFALPTGTPGLIQVQPVAGWTYLNRRNQKPGMVEPIVDIFANHGFTVWGGTWTDPLDWHHFQPPRDVATQLAAMSPADAAAFFRHQAWKI